MTMQQNDNTPGHDLVPWIKPVTPTRNVRGYSDFERSCILEYIIEEVENGGNVLKAAADCECQTSNFYRWLPDFPVFEERFNFARQTELKQAYEKVMEIERRMLLQKNDADWLHGEQARSVLNSIFWRLERLQREKFGKEIKHTHGIEDYAAKLTAAKERLLIPLPGEVVDHVS